MIPFLLYGSYLTGCKVLNRPVELHLTNISLENADNEIEIVIGEETHFFAATITSVKKNANDELASILLLHNITQLRNTQLEIREIAERFK